MDTGGEENIDEADGADSEDNKLVLRIFAEGLEKAITGGAMAGATVGLENGEDGPRRTVSCGLRRYWGWMVPGEDKAEPVGDSPCYEEDSLRKNNTYSAHKHLNSSSLTPEKGYVHTS